MLLPLMKNTIHLNLFISLIHLSHPVMNFVVIAPNAAIVLELIPMKQSMNKNF